MVTQQNTIIWLLDSGAVENNKHRTLCFPISVGFKEHLATPNHTASLNDRPYSAMWV